jgi:hypothetical protein
MACPVHRPEYSVAATEHRNDPLATMQLLTEIANPLFTLVLFAHIYEGFKNESAKLHFWMSPQK